MGIKLEPTIDSIKASRVSNVRKYFNERKETERIKIQQREMICRDINSGKYDHIFMR